LWVMVKHQPKWESVCYQSIEALFKWLMTDEMATCSNHYTPGTSSNKDTPTKEGGVIPLKRPPRERCRKKLRIRCGI